MTWAGFLRAVGRLATVGFCIVVAFSLAIIGCAWFQQGEAKPLPPLPTSAPTFTQKPCPTCEPIPQIMPCPQETLTPLGKAYPHLKDTAKEKETAESAFFRGWTASCIKAGQDQGYPEGEILLNCFHWLNAAIEDNLYEELPLDGWVWPPPTPEHDSISDSA